MRTTSVVMCTYNGAAFVTEQLESFSNQTVLPTEMVVVDDCSNDNTVELLASFAKTAPFDVRIVRNETNLGYSANFEKALRLAQGDLIFCSDQDDVCLPTKVEVFRNALEQAENPGLLYSDCNLVDASLKFLGMTMWQSLGITQDIQKVLTGPQGFEYTLRRANLYCGQSMAITSTLRDKVLPIGFTYDAWIPSVAAALGCVVLIPQPLVHYRQHTAQTSGNKAPTLSNLLKRRWRGVNMFRDPGFYTRWISEYGLLQRRLLEIGGVDAVNLQALEDKLLYLTAALAMRQQPLPSRLPLLAREISSGRYSRFAHGWKSMVVDLLP
jgi:glycosyltransferase involved in cell wall biosynthesis